MESNQIKKGQVVKDEAGNHFIVIRVAKLNSWVESVATRETFLIPNGQLFASDRVTF